jgi:hypothetical protein
MRDACTTYSGISRRYENRIHRCHQQWDDDNTTPRRFTNVTVAADRSSINGAQSSARPTGTRKVVEHVVLFQMKEDFTDEQEKDMLDHLFTLQYRFRGILAISLGRVVGRTPEGVTHALYERFPSKETLEQYMQHPARLKVAEELIIPYYNGLIIADFEAEVEDAIETIFRRGDDFQQGIEHVVFIKVREGTSQAGVSRMLEAFNNLPDQLESSILVQLTAGANFSERSNGYTHAMVARLPSEEALDSFSKHPAYVRVSFSACSTR